MASVHFILYVGDSPRSVGFYRVVLGREARLDVPGMAEFELPGGSVLGLMPEKGIRRLLGSRLPNPESARGIPRCEIYLLVSDPVALLERAIRAGAVELAPVEARTWGHFAGYCLDPDGHVLAFAKPIGDPDREASPGRN